MGNYSQHLDVRLGIERKWKRMKKWMLISLRENGPQSLEQLVVTAGELGEEDFQCFLPVLIKDKRERD